jgi:hypothetical protein
MIKAENVRKMMPINRNDLCRSSDSDEPPGPFSPHSSREGTLIPPSFKLLFIPKNIKYF